MYRVTDELAGEALPSSRAVEMHPPAYRLSLLALCVYAAVLLLFGASAGDFVCIVALMPALAIGHERGARWGRVAGFVLGAMNLVALWALGGLPGHSWTMPAGFVCVTTLAAWLSGRWCDLRGDGDRAMAEVARLRRETERGELQVRALLSALPDEVLLLAGEESPERVRTVASDGRSGAWGLAAPEQVSLQPFGRAHQPSEVLPSEVLARVSASLREVLYGGQPGSVEYQKLDEAGERDMELRLSRYGPGHAIGVVRDVSSRRRLARELLSARKSALEATRLKTRFLANMSHEIRTPMNGVVGMTNLLLATDLSDEQSEYARIIHSSALSLLAIIDDILDFAKIEAGKMELDEVDFDVHACVHEALDPLISRAVTKGLELECGFDTGLPDQLRGDPIRLRQVIGGLVGNAIKFTDQGFVQVRVSHVDSSEDPVRLRFSVRDTGTGISQERQDGLFRPQLLGDGAVASSDSTGLGLAIARQLVEMMGGEIDFESSPSVGSHFWFTTALQPSGQTSVVVGVGDVTGVRVLVVQQCKRDTQRRPLTLPLQMLGVRFEYIRPAEVVLTLLRAQAERDPFLVLLIDAGDELDEVAPCIRELRADPGLRVLPLIWVQRPQCSTPEQAGLSEEVTEVLVWPVRQRALRAQLARIAGIGGVVDSLDDVEPALVAGTDLAGMRVLVVEDNLVNQKVTEQTLRLLGGECVIVGDGQRAVEAVQSEHFDAVLMDVQMPVLDGFAATREIRAKERDGRRLPIVAMTANSLAGERERCLAAGMDDFMCKPVTAGELRGVLERWAAGESEGGDKLPPVLMSSVAASLDMEVVQRLRALDSQDGPDFLQEMVGLFLGQAPMGLEMIVEGLADDNLSTVASQAHQLKSSAAYLGALQLSELCRRMEEAALNERRAELDEIVLEAQREFRTVRGQLETVQAD